MSDVESNIGVVRKVEKAWDSNDLDSLDQHFTEDFDQHTPGAQQGLAGAKENHRGSIAGFPDRRVTIKDIFGEGDKVVVRQNMTGTNDGGLPFLGVPANGNHVDVEWVTIYRLADGKIAESWSQIETPKFMMQLGAMPAPGGM